MGAAPPRTPDDDATDERQNYIVNPAIQPVAPPKGDVQTGQPVGPAHAAMPRDMQRAAVDATFRNMAVPKISRGPSKQFVSQALSEGYNALDTVLNGRPEVRDNVAFSIVTPRNPVRGFSKAELAAQELWKRWNPKLFRALETDTRPGGVYRLDLTNAANQKGYTMRPKEAGGPIDIRINPLTAGPETFPHEAQHAFAFRRQPRGPGSPLNMGGMNVLPQEVQQEYMRYGGGDPFHAAVYYRADEAAKRTGRASTRGRSLLEETPHSPAR
jgi:hypothetical protein